MRVGHRGMVSEHAGSEAVMRGLVIQGSKAGRQAAHTDSALSGRLLLLLRSISDFGREVGRTEETTTTRRRRGRRGRRGDAGTGQRGWGAPTATRRLRACMGRKASARPCRARVSQIGRQAFSLLHSHGKAVPPLSFIFRAGTVGCLPTCLSLLGRWTRAAGRACGRHSRRQ